MIDWKEAQQQKFWSLVIALVAPSSCRNVDGSIERITAIIGGFAAIIVYILAEASVDAQAANKDNSPR